MTYSLFGLPEAVKFCEKCVISNQRPASTVEMLSDGTRKVGINISKGICDACRYNEIKQNEINWEQRSSQLYDMLSVYRRNDGTHDVLVPSSGGKDSSYTAFLLKYKYDMNPLCITWAPNMFTEVGRHNLESLTSIGGLDSIVYTPNGKLHRYLTKLAFSNFYFLLAAVE